MSKITISNTFKRVSFSFVAAFLTAMVISLLIGLFAEKVVSMSIGFGTGLGALIFAYTKFPTWFPKA